MCVYGGVHMYVSVCAVCTFLLILHVSESAICLLHVELILVHSFSSPKKYKALDF
jgi:hypothetical protein